MAPHPGFLGEDGYPGASERAQIAAQLVALGVAGADAAAIVAGNPTYGLVVDRTIAHCRVVPKGDGQESVRI